MQLENVSIWRGKFINELQFGKHRTTGDLPLVPMRSTFLLLSMVRVVISDWIVSRFVVFICQGSRQI